MKIIRFNCQGVHGYLNIRLGFHSDLTFLTGINGSGKTSAVRALTALLTPTLRDLANLTYEELQITLEDDGRELTITSRKAPDYIELTCSGVRERLLIPILPADAYEPSPRFAERERHFYREQEAINARHPVLMRIDALPTPMFLDLERRHQGGMRGWADHDGVHRHTPANPLAGSLLESLRDAQALAETTYRKSLATRTELTDRLKQEIILTTFEPTRSKHPIFGLRLPDRSIKSEIKRNQDLVHLSLSQIGIPTERIEGTVLPFFSKAQEVVDRLPFPRGGAPGRLDEAAVESLQAWAAIEPKLAQIDSLVELIRRYDSAVRSEMEPIERYRSSVNIFLRDSGKQIFFDGSGNLRVDLANYGKTCLPSALSSGERQLVVILTHLAFNSRARHANILIIDEPELSLHVRWQELFVDTVLSASPGIQLILATHSPSVIGGRIDNCVDVQEGRDIERLLG